MGIGLVVLLLAIAAAAAAGGKRVIKLDNVPDQNAEAFNRALAEERNPRELRSFAAAAIASGAPNYARALTRKFLLLEGVPEPQVDAEVERFLRDPTLIQAPPPTRGPAAQPTEGPAPAPGVQVPAPTPPGLSSQDAAALLGAVRAVMASQNPQAMRLLASQLRSPGDTITQGARQAAADALDATAAQFDRAQAAPVGPGIPITSPGLPTAPAPGVSPPPGPPPQATPMPVALRAMFLRALQSNEVQALGTAARVLEDAGFANEGAQLRQKARDIAARTPPPPPDEQPSRTLDPSMPANLAADVAKQLAIQGDPKILRRLAASIRASGFSQTADLLDAKAAQLETVIRAGQTLRDVQDIVREGEQLARSPGQPEVHVSPQPGGGVPVTLAPAPKLPQSQPAPTRPAPSPAPRPKPQPLPAPKTPVQIAAENMQKHLLQIVAVHGLPGAKGKEDSFLIQKFQGAAGDANPDGKYGPGTALKSAGVVSDIAPVFQWPKASNKTTVANYRNELLRLSLQAESDGNAARAEQLAKSARRERGLGGVAGGPLAA